MEMRSEKGKVLQLYNILLLLVKKKKKKIWNTYDHMLICEVFFFWVLNTQELDLLIYALGI